MTAPATPNAFTRPVPAALTANRPIGPHAKHTLATHEMTVFTTGIAPASIGGLKAFNSECSAMKYKENVSPPVMHALPAKRAFNRFFMNFVILLFGSGYRRFWQEAELPCHADVISGGPMFDDQAVSHPEHVDVFRLEAIAGRRYARQQPFVDKRILANPLMGSTNHTTRHDPIPFRQDVERRHFHIRECIQDVLKYGANHIAVDRDTVIDHLVGEKFALSCESFLFAGLEHLPNGNFILFYHVYYSFNFSSISV